MSMLLKDNFWYAMSNSSPTPLLCLDDLHQFPIPHNVFHSTSNKLYLLGGAKPGGGGPPAGNPGGGKPPNPGGGAPRPGNPPGAPGNPPNPGGAPIPAGPYSNISNGS